MPINGRLYELDGLKPYPVDHGPCTSAQTNGIDEFDTVSMLTSVLANSLNGLTSISSGCSFDLAASLNWTSKFKQIILNRLNSFNNGHHEIRFNLMAVVPDRIQILREQIEMIEENRQRIQKLIETSTSVETLEFKPATPNSSSIIDDNNSNNSEAAVAAEQRQLRSASLRRSNPSLKPKSNSVDVTFRTSGHGKINEFLKQASGMSDTSARVKILNRLRVELGKMLDKIDLIDACKMFRVHATMTTTSNVSQLDSPTTAMSVEEMFTLRKSTSLSELRSVEARLRGEAEADEMRMNDEAEKRKKYRV